MKELLNIDIANLPKEQLNDLKERLNDFIKPYNDRLSEIYGEINEIDKQEYLNNRKIKNYPVLEDLLSKIGDTYKDVIIDLDEFLGFKRYSSIRIYNEIQKYCDSYNLEFAYDLADCIKDFLIDNNIVIPQYEIYCSRCSDRIMVFSSNPKSETFVDDLYKEMNGYLINIDNKEVECDDCNECIDLTEEYNISQSDFYKIIREED